MVNEYLRNYFSKYLIFKEYLFFLEIILISIRRYPFFLDIILINIGWSRNTYSS